MLTTFLRVFCRSPKKLTPLRLDETRTHSPRAQSLAPLQRTSLVEPDACASLVPIYDQPRMVHRERLMSMQLRHSKLCPESKCVHFEQHGIETVGDLLTADLRTLSKTFPSPDKSVRAIKRYRSAIRLAARVPEMMPRDALLLICIHRRSVRGLAMESPMLLYRDLQRYADSTPGQKMLRGRKLPSIKRVRSWIAACAKDLQSQSARLC